MWAREQCSQERSNIIEEMYVNLFYVPKKKYYENVYFIVLFKNISEEKWVIKSLLAGSWQFSQSLLNHRGYFQCALCCMCHKATPSHQLWWLPSLTSFVEESPTSFVAMMEKNWSSYHLPHNEELKECNLIRNTWGALQPGSLWTDQPLIEGVKVGYMLTLSQDRHAN